MAVNGVEPLRYTAKIGLGKCQFSQPLVWYECMDGSSFIIHVSLESLIGQRFRTVL